MELILIHKGAKYICQYDEADHELISQYKWNYCKGYAATYIKGKNVSMHRLILGLTDPSIQGDHINHDRLNNCRANIRSCTPKQNQRNRIKGKGNSKFKGVYKDANKWHVQIVNDEKQITLGRFRSELTAAKVYDKAARKLFREFANPNFKEVQQEPEQLTINIK